MALASTLKVQESRQQQREVNSRQPVRDRRGSTAGDGHNQPVRRSLPGSCWTGDDNTKPNIERIVQLQDLVNVQRDRLQSLLRKLVADGTASHKWVPQTPFATRIHDHEPIAMAFRTRQRSVPLKIASLLLRHDDSGEKVADDGMEQGKVVAQELWNVAIPHRTNKHDVFAKT